MSARPRLPAEERRAAVLDTACRVFSRCSYRAATTAEIAREAGVTEPILYRHFASKQALYLACIDDAWERIRAAWDEAVAAEPDPAAWTQAMSTAFFQFKEQRSAVATLWLHALTESGDDPEIRKYLRRHLREVHDFVADVLTRCQAAGAVPAERDAAGGGVDLRRGGAAGGGCRAARRAAGGRARSDSGFAARLADGVAARRGRATRAVQGTVPVSVAGSRGCLSQGGLWGTRAPRKPRAPAAAPGALSDQNY